MSAVEIYGLFDPDTGELRYVGKANNAAKRLKTHLQERVHKRPVNNWVRSLVMQGKSPVMRVLETVAKDKWEEAERRLIAQHRKTSNLLNLADGGAMPSQTKEQRVKATRASNELQQSMPKQWKRLQAAKKDLGRLYERFSKSNSAFDLSLAACLRFRMRLDAARRPEIYGSWAAL